MKETYSGHIGRILPFSVLTAFIRHYYRQSLRYWCSECRVLVKKSCEVWHRCSQLLWDTRASQGFRRSHLRMDLTTYRAIYLWFSEALDCISIGRIFYSHLILVSCTQLLVELERLLIIHPIDEKVFENLWLVKVHPLFHTSIFLYDWLLSCWVSKTNIEARIIPCGTHNILRRRASRSCTTMETASVILDHVGFLSKLKFCWKKLFTLVTCCDYTEYNIYCGSYYFLDII
jgi:hypothetical protein